MFLLVSKLSNDPVKVDGNFFCHAATVLSHIRMFSFLHRECIQLFRERLSGKVHATILKGIVGGFKFSLFQRNLNQLAQKAMEMCLRVLKESNKSRFDSYNRQEHCIDHIPYYLSGLSRAHFFRQPFSK